MGRYDFRPLRVREAAKALFDTRYRSNLPQWYDVLGNIPTTETLARPVQRVPDSRRAAKTKKPSRMFQPLPLRYEEDKLRSEFFGDHPWELARPRVVLEDSGNDAKGYDWRNIVQRGKQLDGESVVQRQLYLMKHAHLSKPAAYDQARHEFYTHRRRQEIKRRVAKEEALHVGAYFGDGPLAIGMGLEDRAWEAWKTWASKMIEDEEAVRSQLFSGPQIAEIGDDEEGAAVDDGFADEAEMLTQGEYEQAAEVVGDSVPGSRRGQAALGGAAMHP